MNNMNKDKNIYFCDALKIILKLHFPQIISSGPVAQGSVLRDQEHLLPGGRRGAAGLQKAARADGQHPTHIHPFLPSP